MVYTEHGMAVASEETEFSVQENGFIRSTEVYFQLMRHIAVEKVTQQHLPPSEGQENMKSVMRAISEDIVQF